MLNGVLSNPRKMFIPDLSRVPDYLIEGSQNFALFTWFTRDPRNVMDIYGKSSIQFGCKSHAVFIYSERRLAIATNAHYLFESSFLSNTNKKDFFIHFNELRVNVEHTLDEKWGVGHLAEDYLFTAISRCVHVKELVEASPILLICFQDGLGSPKMYKNVEIGVEHELLESRILLKLAQLTDDPTIFNELLKLPVDTLEAL